MLPDSTQTYGILHALGFDPLLLTAGFLGGLLRAFFDRPAKPTSVVIAVTFGFVVGNYLGATVAIALKPIVAEGAALGIGALIAGFCAQDIMGRIAKALVKAFDRRFGNGNNDGRAA